jgi:hypothetical protein
MIIEGTLDECIRKFMSQPKSQHHLYEIHTAPQSDLVSAILSADHVVELVRLRVSRKGDAATSATKPVARTVSPPRETDGGIFMSKRKSSTSATASSEPRNRPFDDPTAWKHYKSFGVIGALDDFGFEIGEDFRQGLLEFRSLIAAVGNQRDQASSIANALFEIASG